MQSVLPEMVFKIYPICLRFLDENVGELETEVLSSLDSLADFPQLLSSLVKEHNLALFLPDLARLELAVYRAGASESEIPAEVVAYQINPTLQMVELGWRHLTRLFAGGKEAADETLPEPGGEIVLLWRPKDSDEIARKVADDEDLLVLKMIMEGLAAEKVAAQGNLPVGAVDLSLDRAVERGLVLSPASLLRRGAWSGSLARFSAAP